MKQLIDRFRHRYGAQGDKLRQALAADRDQALREQGVTLDLSTIGHTLRELREGAGLTQAQLAEKLGTKQSAIARLEKDTEGNLSLLTLARFALACGFVPLDMTLIDPREAEALIMAALPSGNSVPTTN